jgi:broad specificity phosphatase PhoE
VRTTRVVLCRHGETEASAKDRFCGALDVGLSAAGKAEAAQLAASFRSRPGLALYTSPARRALETAGPMGESLGLRPIVEPQLRELDFGEIDGLRYEDVATQRPELYDEWLRSPTRVRFPGGECYADLQHRTVAAVSALTERHQGGAAIVVTHAGAIRALLAAWLSVPDELVFRIDQRNGSVNIVDWLDGTPVVRLVNGPPATPALAG